MKNQIELGDYVRHNITGFEGTVIGITKWLSGCDRVAIQPKVDKEGKLKENQSFDLPEMKILKKGVHASTPKDTGGPHSIAHRGHETPRR